MLEFDIVLHYRLSKNGATKSSDTTLAALETKIPYMLRFLGDEDDDVSSAVIEFATEYIATIKTMPVMSEVQKKHIEVNGVSGVYIEARRIISVCGLTI